MPTAADLYYHVYEGSPEGQRPPVVLLHGAGGSHLHWPSEMRRLPGYRVYAPDLPGHGKSGGRGQQSIPSYARMMIAWLEALGLHSAVFVGHSMGSAIALYLALENQEHVLGLGIVGGGARLSIPAELLDQASSDTTFHSAVEMVTAWSFSTKTSSQLVELAGKRMADTRASVLYGDFMACIAFDITDRVGEIVVPTLVVCGAEDRMMPLRHSQYLANHIPGAILKPILDAGHMVMLEKPQESAAVLSGFLRSIPF